MEKVRYMISDAAAAVDVETHVLRYWEDELGLDVPRNELGHRYYTRDNIKQFLRIKELKEKGYQLRAIRDMLHSDAPGEPLNPPNPAAMEKSVQPVNYTNITNQTVKQEMSGYNPCAWILSFMPRMLFLILKSSGLASSAISGISR